MAHSTGGLITPLYLDSKKGNLPVDGLILNSPFLDWNFGWFMEKVAIPAVAFVGRLFPNLTVQGYGIASYAHSLLKQFKGEWEYDTNWKMINGHPKKAGWIKAIQEGQQKVRKGLKLDCPILVMSSIRRQRNGTTNTCRPISCSMCMIFRSMRLNWETMSHATRSWAAYTI